MLKAMLADAHRRDLISRDPCDKVKWKDEAPPPEISLKVPSPTDVERLIAKTAEPWCLLVELAAYSGLGAGELTGLQARHIDAVARSVRVEQIIMDLDGVLLIGKPRSKAGYRTVTDLDPDPCAGGSPHTWTVSAAPSSSSAAGTTTASRARTRTATSR